MSFHCSQTLVQIYAMSRTALAASAVTVIQFTSVPAWVFSWMAIRDSLSGRRFPRVTSSKEPMAGRNSS
jgi:hypothetical protein